MWSRALLLAGLLGCLPLTVQAARSVTVGQPLVIRLEQHQPTTVAFPESIIKVIIGYDKDTIEADNVGPYLVLQPLVPELAGRVNVIGESGTLYPATYKMGSPSDDVIHVTVPTPARKAVEFTPASLLRALRLGTPIPGQQAGNVAIPSFPDPRLVPVDATSLRVGGLYGLTLTLRNAHTQAVLIDVRLGARGPFTEDMVSLTSVVWPPMFEVCLISEAGRLEPGVVTQLHVVLKRKETHALR